MYKIIYVKWEDAVGADGWTNMDYVQRQALTTIETVGFLVKETDKFLTVIHSVDEENSNSGAWMTIPKTQIKKRKYLKI